MPRSLVNALSLHHLKLLLKDPPDRHSAVLHSGREHLAVRQQKSINVPITRSALLSFLRGHRYAVQSSTHPTGAQQ
jgi:hypothetical protein